MDYDYSEIDYTSCEGILEDWDDGHVPEFCSQPTRLLRQPLYHRSNGHIVVHNDAISNEVTDALYEKTIDPWGIYFTKEELRAEPLTETNRFSLESLARHAASVFMKAATRSSAHSLPGQQNDADHSIPPWKNDYDYHGVAVWGLASYQGASVPYHVDYAEQVRYHTNTIVLPVLAGTLQCTPDEMIGGDFGIILKNGLEHYRKHGYKSENAKDGLIIPHQRGRMVCHSGHLPHWSTRIEELKRKRVILGFNVFLNNVGPWVKQAPEHSAAFQKQVQLCRALHQKNQWSVQAIQENPTMAKLLVQAKREKVRRELQQTQDCIDRAAQVGVRISQVLQECAKSGEFPNNNDVLCHLERQCRLGNLLLDTEEVTLDSKVVSTAFSVTAN